MRKRGAQSTVRAIARQRAGDASSCTVRPAEALAQDAREVLRVPRCSRQLHDEGRVLVIFMRERPEQFLRAVAAGEAKRAAEATDGLIDYTETFTRATVAP